MGRPLARSKRDTRPRLGKSTMPPSHVAIWVISFVKHRSDVDSPSQHFRGMVGRCRCDFACGAGTDAVAGWHSAVARGSDVYLFLAGMMLLAQLAQTHGVFDWLATLAVQACQRFPSPAVCTHLHAIGTLVTIFMSNDATAVVLTPAVLASVKKSKVDPLPYLFICAFIANAASFVLPISNPANLVVFHDRRTAARPMDGHVSRRLRCFDCRHLSRSALALSGSTARRGCQRTWRSSICPMPENSPWLGRNCRDRPAHRFGVGKRSRTADLHRLRVCRSRPLSSRANEPTPPDEGHLVECASSGGRALHSGGGDQQCGSPATLPDRTPSRSSIAGRSQDRCWLR